MRLAIPSQIALWSAWVLTFVLIAAAAMNSLRLSCWPCDLLSHFPTHGAVAAVVAAAAFTAVRRIRYVVVPAGVAVWNLLGLVPFYASPPTALAAPSADGRVIRVVAMNVAAHNRDSQRVIRFIRAANPDVLLVTELNSFWVTALEELAVDLAFRQLEPREGHYGIGLMSRLGLSVRDDKPAGAQSIVARISKPQLMIIGTHAFPPFTPLSLVRRNQQFAEIAAFVRQRDEPVVLVGDLNSSSWSPGFQDLLRDAGLFDTRLGRGVQATWPAWLPIAQVPIDHALVSRGVRVHARFVGERVGSDHLPVVLDFSLDEP